MYKTVKTAIRKNERKRKKTWCFLAIGKNGAMDKKPKMGETGVITAQKRFRWAESEAKMSPISVILSSMTAPNRYLVSFDSRRSIHQFTDVLIIGAGIAGIRAALEIPADLNVLVITKDSLRESNSAYAQGGIAGVLSPEDRFENHIDDTLIAGAGLCDREVVEMVIREAPHQIGDLVRFGTIFDLVNGELALTREGGHSHRRIVHALGDATGHEVMRALIARAKATPNVELRDETFTLDLLTHEGCCVGAMVWRPGLGTMLIWAKQVILAAGGCGMVYRETTNPPVATGDGMAAAYRAGAELRDMEFMQFHPTVLYVAGSARYLISEAVRGEGAYLRDLHGERFMLNEDPRAELAPRDIVSRAIYRCMERTQHPNVYLDLSHLDPVMVRERFPGINRVCRSFGLHITKDRIPVRPGAHYMIGGITVDQSGRTSLPGLWPREKLLRAACTARTVWHRIVSLKDWSTAHSAPGARPRMRFG